MFKVNDKNTRTMPITYFTPCSSVFIVNIEQVNAGTTIRTGITCRKIPCYMLCATQLAGGLLLKKLKCFEVMLNIF